MKNTEAIMRATAEFYSALNQIFLGNVNEMKQIWSHAADVTYMGPACEFAVGWDNVLIEWEKQAAQRLGGKVEPKHMHVIPGEDIAVVSNCEHGENTNIHGKAEYVAIRTTNIFRKEDGRWKMIAHHTDLLPHLVGVQKEI